MSIRANSCLRNDGTPKSAYPTRDAAQRWLEKRPGTAVHVEPYPCATHGWHVGGKPEKAPHRRRSKGRW